MITTVILSQQVVAMSEFELIQVPFCFVEIVHDRTTVKAQRLCDSVSFQSRRRQVQSLAASYKMCNIFISKYFCRTIFILDHSSTHNSAKRKEI